MRGERARSHAGTRRLDPHVGDPHGGDLVGDLAGQETALFDDDEFRQVYLAFDEGFDWSPDDPRLEGLADRVADLLKQLAARMTRTERTTRWEDEVVALLDSHSIGASPAWRALGA